MAVTGVYAKRDRRVAVDGDRLHLSNKSKTERRLAMDQSFKELGEVGGGANKGVRRQRTK